MNDNFLSFVCLKYKVLLLKALFCPEADQAVKA